MSSKYEKLKKVFANDPEMLSVLESKEARQKLTTLADKINKDNAIEIAMLLKKGDEGKPGKDGITPKKGEDYFTDDEVEQIAKYIKHKLKEEVTPIKDVDYRDGKDADEQKIIREVSKIIPTVGEILAQIKIPEIPQFNEQMMIDRFLEKIPKPIVPTIEEIVKEIKEKRLIELRDIKGARLDGRINNNDQRWHGGGLSNITGLISAGTNISITGSGTSSDPYVINADGGASGITSINADGTAAQILAVGTAGTDFAIVDNGTGTHTFNLPTASALNRGALSSADWTTFNNKQDTITPAALSKTDDTNVTLTLGGSPTTALLAATSLTLGWSGQLSLARGGTGANLSDPGANTILAWDDTDNSVGFWTLGSGLSYDHSTHTLSASGTPISFGTVGQIPYTNALGTDFDYSAGMSYDGTNLLLTGSLGLTGSRVLKGWFTDLEITNMPTVGGISLSSIFSPIAGSASIVTVGTITSGVWNGTDVALSAGGTGASLSDPNANSLWGWDDTDGSIGFWTIGTGLSYDHATHTLSATGGVPTTITVANEATDTSCFISFFTAATGDLGPKTNATLTYNSNTGLMGTQSLAITGTAGAGYMTLIAQSANPTSPAAGTLLLHAFTTQGFTRLEQDNESPTNLILGRDNVIIARNTSGGTINKGMPVYVTGSTGNAPNIAKARANSITTMPAVGVVMDDMLNTAFGQVMVLGNLSRFDTSAFSTGDQVYVDPNTAGVLTNVRPSGTTNIVQLIGRVLVSGIGNGSLQVATAPFLGNSETGTNATTWIGTNIILGGSLGATGTRVLKGWFTDLEVTNAIAGSITGNAGTASAVAVGGITGLGTGVATALAVNVGSAGAFIVNGGALGTPASGTVTNLTGTASININGTVGATTPTTGVFTIATLNTGLMPDANDGAYLGQAGTAFSDLFLASGGLINWDSGNATITHSASLLTSNVDIAVPDEAYGAGWNGSLEVPTKNAVYDKVQTLGGPQTIMSTIFETAARFNTNASGGTNTFGADGVRMTTTNTANRRAGLNVSMFSGATSGNVFAGSPCFSACFHIQSPGTAGFMMVGPGLVTTAATALHFGFKIEFTAGPTATLYGSQADGTTESKTAALTTLTNEDIVEVFAQKNSTTSVDYYWRKNGGAWSAATNLATNMPVNANQCFLNWVVTNAATATTNTVDANSYSYQSK